MRLAIVVSEGMRGLISVEQIVPFLIVSGVINVSAHAMDDQGRRVIVMCYGVDSLESLFVFSRGYFGMSCRGVFLFVFVFLWRLGFFLIFMCGGLHSRVYVLKRWCVCGVSGSLLCSCSLSVFSRAVFCTSNNSFLFI